MLGCFPDPYPDETLFSVFARFSERMHYPFESMVSKDLFGRGRAVAIDLPTHLEDLVAALPPQHVYTVDYLIDAHTVFPFYGPFLRHFWFQQMRQEMRGTSGSGGSLFYIRQRSLWLHCCLDCMSEDRQRFAEAYWHRIHQVDGVQICPIHGNTLYKSGLHAVKAHFMTAERAELAPLGNAMDEQQHQETLLRLAKDAAWLLSQPNFNPDLECIHWCYQRLLRQRGFADAGEIQYFDLYRAFEEAYPDTFLTLLHCHLDLWNMRRNWLDRLISPEPETFRPLYHLLLFHLLGYTAGEFFALAAQCPSSFVAVQ
jgi:hypothetical protein